MTMHKWRSLFGIGCLMAVLALFGSTTAFAQPPASPVTDGSVKVTVPTMGGFNSLSVAWEYALPSNATTDVAAASFEIGYKQTTSPSPFEAGVALDGTMTVDASATATSYRVGISDLKAGKRYLVAVRSKSSKAITATMPTNTTDWVYSFATTSPAPKPSDVDYRDVMVKPGNGMLMVEWEEPLPGHDDLIIKEYMVQFSKKEKTGYTAWPHKPTESMVQITGLDNETMYYVQIKATNDAGGTSAKWSKAVMGTPSADAMPTPALPVFGAFALGAGLLAAGRARLRRREQRQLTR